MKVRVASMAWETPSVRSIGLTAIDGEPLPPFGPGAHIELRMGSGVSRSYSLMNAPSERAAYRIGVARAPGGRGGSAYIVDQLRVGDELEASEPRNLFPLEEMAQRTVLFGGGIGITPLLAMAARLAELGRDFTLYYAVRSRSELAFASRLQHLGDRVVVHVDDEAGRVLDIASVIAGEVPETHYYCCGPTPMVQAFEALASSVPAEQVHVEYFSAVELPATEAAFTVELARSGRTIAIPKGLTILEVLLEQGFAVPNSCQQGVCGECETRVVSGEPDHRDAVLSPAERVAGKSMMICCSGARTSRLVLDL